MAAASSGDAKGGGAGRWVNLTRVPSWGKMVAMTLEGKAESNQHQKGLYSLSLSPSYSPDLLTKGGDLVLPVHQHARRSQHSS